jgi:hypothetical protein
MTEKRISYLSTISKESLYRIAEGDGPTHEELIGFIKYNSTWTQRLIKISEGLRPVGIRFGQVSPWRPISRENQNIDVRDMNPQEVVQLMVNQAKNMAK